MRSSTALMVIGLFSAGLGLLAASQPARADICFDLWVQRNSIYKAYGYCFKSQKAIDYFGIGGCIYHNEASIPMSAADKKRVLNIKSQEKKLGCL